MRCYVEPSPSGGYWVRVQGVEAPVSRHDTEEEAEAAAAIYTAGLGRGSGELVTLSDGSDVLIRPVQAEDKALFVAGWDRFGEQSRYRRFMGHKKQLTKRDLEFFTEIDHVDHEALGALTPAGDEGLAVARYMRDPERPHLAEAAVAVVDGAQGRGLGGALLRRLRARAQENGIHAFTASLFTDNAAMLALFRRIGTVSVRDNEDSILEIDVELPVSDAPKLGIALRTAATGKVGPRQAAGA